MSEPSDGDETSRVPRRYDAIVIGAGVAGLAFTLRLPSGWRVALLTKGSLGESNTRYAQGGLAAAVGRDDSPALHLADTIAAGAGLCDVDAVQALVEGAPAAVDWLVGLGAGFDQAADGTPLLGREAAHGRRRVLHAGGDATGAEIERAMVTRVRANPGVDVYEEAFARDFIVADGRCHGLIAQLQPAGPSVALVAPLTVLAAGGAGQLWATTSNPPGATADGLALALRARVAVADLEFVQFHPTVLALPESAPFLISEAVRGEGAYLRGADGERFMVAVHPLAELAARDVVARGIHQQMADGRQRHVHLDLRHLDPAAMRARFPTIAEELALRGLDLATDLIPVAPAAHYSIGGVVAGTAGETSLPGLLALGEVSCTGVHGANRLASNSLLEGLVFGLAAADEVGDRRAEVGGRAAPVDTNALSEAHVSPSRRTVEEMRGRLQAIMSQHVAVVRDAEGLAEAATAINRIQTSLMAGANGAADARPSGAVSDPRRATWELRNMLTVAAVVVDVAARREESRGAHFRRDFPGADPTLAGCHQVFAGGEWRFGPLRAEEDRHDAGSSR